MSFSNSKFGNILSKTKDKISSFISDVLYKPQNTYSEINSFLNNNKISNKSNKIDLYRSDYIPSKYNDNNSFLKFESKEYPNFLGQKTLRTNDISSFRKINIPNDKRYHKSLLESSLDKIRNEIRHKREENIQRMNELNNKSDKLNDFFNNESNNKGKFTSMFKTNDKNNNSNSINLNENEENIYNTNNSFNEISYLNKSDLKRTFNEDLIKSDINESFSFYAKNKKKKLDYKIISIQKQTEFAFNVNNKINDNNVKITFGVPKEEIKYEPISDKAIFGVNPIFNKEEQKSDFDNKEKNKEEKKSVFDNEEKVIFGAPKEPIISKPLSDVVSFGFKKNKKKKQEKKNINILFGAPKEIINSEPSMEMPKFGLIEKEEKKEENKKDENNDKILLKPLNDKKEIDSHITLKPAITFGINKDEENKKENNKSLLSPSNPFLMNYDNEKEKDKEIVNPFKNDKSENNLFNNSTEKESSNLFLNNKDKKTKVISINAVDTSSSPFDTKEQGNRDTLFGNIGIFGNLKNDEKKDENRTNSLFGDSNLINNKGSLFGNMNDKDNSLFGKNKNEDSNLLTKEEKNDDKKISLFGNNKNSNSTSLFQNINTDNNNSSLFGNSNNNNDFSLFGQGSKTSLFGNNNNSSLFGNESNDKNKNNSLFGNSNITFNFGK